MSDYVLVHLKYQHAILVDRTFMLETHSNYMYAAQTLVVYKQTSLLHAPLGNMIINRIKVNIQNAFASTSLCDITNDNTLFAPDHG